MRSKYWEERWERVVAGPRVTCLPVEKGGGRGKRIYLQQKGRGISHVSGKSYLHLRHSTVPLWSPVSHAYSTYTLNAAASCGRLPFGVDRQTEGGCFTPLISALGSLALA